ncbi:DUF664 domain-containing protein [Streptomyces sp. NPDC014991]|uniref:mycothiol transferase n=1 Tax=Streptomyces sp. NPDC014991 TaxID=3364935 RepID=UPI0037015393
MTLRHILVRVISETQRHAGHADIVRELIDGSVGYSQGKDNMSSGDRAWWEGYRSRLERVRRRPRRQGPGTDENIVLYASIAGARSGPWPPT